ncbi:MAG: helix-turn-helix domain-containing protein [Oscillospiraceae bacterium]|nr:helix-turn-helix domain-containing protein [Oscillospiraceae bacterium]
MEISLALILDELGPGAVRYISEGASPKFTSAELFIPGQPYYSPDKLLVCRLSEALAADKRFGSCFLCARDTTADADADEAALAGICVAPGDAGLRDLFNRVMRLFVRVAEWVMAMERSVAKHSGIQELLDLSEPVFGNFITIQDSTFKLIAHTKNIEPPGPVMSRLVEYGFQPPETMELFRRHRRLEEYKTISDIVVSRDRITSDYDVVKKTFHLGGSMFIIVVMECCKKPADNATVELFGMLIEHIEAYANVDITKTGGIAGVKALAQDILEGATGNKEEARVRSTYCGYPFEGGFRLFVFTFEDEENVPFAQLVHVLTEACRDGVSFYYENNVLMLEPGNSVAGSSIHAGIQPDIEKTCEAALGALAGFEFVCGISGDFDCLWELPTAFEQAKIASSVLARLRVAGAVVGAGAGGGAGGVGAGGAGVGSAGAGIRARFRLFSQSLVYFFADAARLAAPGVFDSSFLSRGIAALREHDAQHHTDTERILRLFLENERNATKVASSLHMHRNTVLYHIERISGMLGVSLDDPDVRLMLMLAFKAHDLGALGKTPAII